MTDQSGTKPEEITLYHSTGPRSKKNLIAKGFTAAFSSKGSFIKGDWFLDTPQIPKSVAAKGEIVLQQRVSTRGIIEITNPKLLEMLHGICGAGEGATEMRTSVWSEARRAAVGRAPLTGETDLQAYMREQIVKAHPEAAEAPAIRWRNPDGTYTYLVRNKSAYLDRPKVSPISMQSRKGSSMQRMRTGGKLGIAVGIGGGLMLASNVAEAAWYIKGGKSSSERMERAREVGTVVGFWATLGEVIGGIPTLLLGLTQMRGENPNQIERDIRAEQEAFLKLQERYQRELFDNPPGGLSPWGIPKVGNPQDVFKYRQP